MGVSRSEQHPMVLGSSPTREQGPRAPPYTQLGSQGRLPPRKEGRPPRCPGHPHTQHGPPRGQRLWQQGAEGQWRWGSLARVLAVNSQPPQDPSLPPPSCHTTETGRSPGRRLGLGREGGSATSSPGLARTCLCSCLGREAPGSLCVAVSSPGWDVAQRDGCGKERGVLLTCSPFVSIAKSSL